MSINRVNITGNLTRDPELRATAGGTQVLSFGVAVNARRRSSWERDGQRRSKLEVIVDEIEFMSSRGGQGGYDQGGYAPAAPAPAARPAAPVATPPAGDVYDEDIPF